MSYSLTYTEPFFHLYHENLQLLLFGGKGGVGKTTIAAAFSLYISDRYPQKRFLVISTDPAHSLSDSFDYPLGSSPKPIYGRANLSGMEIDSEKLFLRFQAENSQRLKKILYRGTYLDEEDISRLLELSFPGLDELMALKEIIDLLGSSDYDMLIVDTAPTGHTLRLLDLPVLIQAWIGFLDTLMEKHRYMSRIYSRTRIYKPDDTDDFINALAGDILKIRKLLQDKSRCRFVPIALAEPIVFSETHRLLLALTKNGISVRDVLVNQVMIDPGDCETCCATSEIQCFQLEMFRKEWLDLHISLLPAWGMEVKGEKRLRSFGRVLASTEHFGHPQGMPLQSIHQQVTSIRIPTPDRSVDFGHPQGMHLLFLFCGKGGVGKTTLSSAFAIQLSSCFPDKKILLFSTDPAHSLSDCVGERIGSKETRIGSTGNLFAVEIDPESLFREFKGSYAHQIEEVFHQFSRRSGMEVPFDKEVLTKLLDLAPPGIDEIMALSRLSDYVEQDRYDLYVLDAAPTGHALRFLELPNLVQEWLRAFFQIILKYKGTIRFPKTSELLVEMSKKVKRVQQLLSDPKSCECILVSIPTEIALSETQRLLSHLTRLRIPSRRLMLNRMVTFSGHCHYCDSLTSAHELMLVKFKDVLPKMEIVPIPQWAGEVRGINALSSLISFEE